MRIELADENCLEGEQRALSCGLKCDGEVEVEVEV